MKKYNTEAIVLKNLNYGDAHKIYTLMTRDFGKISAVARGVRKISSRRAGNLDTLNKIVVSITENKDGYRNIQEVKTLKSNKKVKEKLDTSANGFYLADLVQVFVDFDHENNEVYELLDQTLDLLERNHLPISVVVNFFEIQLMKILGYEMALKNCAKCKREYKKDWKSVKFNQTFGGFICDDCEIVGFDVEKPAADVLSFLGTGFLGELFDSENSAKQDIADHINDEKTLNTVNSLVKSYLQGIIEDNAGYGRVRKSLFPLI